MQTELKILPAALFDIQQAKSWYELQQPGLGQFFLDAVEQTIELIRHSPNAYALADDEIRHAMIRRFPYSIFYVHESNQVIINAVMHSKRHPMRWKTRPRR